MTSALLRCAIYTRVSTEHGLDQDFNSLDNQREAAEAYIRSQAHEGWRPLAGRYDDGGFSGGSLQRPALQALLTLVRARRLDIVVVYKVDRLTRSLADFAKLVELFDQHGVSFVSVTQAFNTTTSMGRLTLNVLLSFAQFEREVTGERIRDKIAGSKGKGIWMGGVVPLGYRVESRALHVVEDHAAVVRMIFARYRELGSVPRLKQHLDQAGVTVPQRTDGAGRVTGGRPFSRGHLHKLLANPIYAGRLGHKGRVHPGQHAAIVEPDSFEAVQAQLASHHQGRRRRSPAAGAAHVTSTQASSTQVPSTHLLAGRIRTGEGRPMTPSHARKGQVRYRYYLARAVLEGGTSASPIRRLAAPALEAAVVAGLRSAVRAKPDVGDAELVATHLTHVSVHPDRLELEMVGRDEPLLVPWSPASRQRRRDILLPPGRADSKLRPMKAEDRARMLRAIGKARGWMRELTEGRCDGTDAIAARERLTERAVRLTLTLAQLAPSIVTAIVAGRLPRGIAIRDLAALPTSWAEQERWLGIG